VPRAKQRIDTDLFEPERHLDLINAILSAFDGITATRQAVEADAAGSAASDEDAEAEEAASE
jgi:hypothetical protein